MPNASPVPYPQYPTLQVTHSLILFATALHASGAATIIAGVVGRKTLMWKGIFQLLLTPLIVGIVWSLVSQYRLLKNAQAAEAAA
jgi:hypothetical protein